MKGLVCVVSSSFGDLAPFVEETASRAYEQMTAWFGPPADAQRPYEVMPWHFTACGSGLLLGHYILLIDEKCEDRAELAALISHEMYHRVTMRRRTLRRQTWVDEMLAYLASQKFLETQGYIELSRKIEAAWQREKVAVDFAALHKARPRRVLLGLRGIAYPAGFGVMVTKLGVALDMLLSWEDVCSLARVNSIEAFYAALPAEDLPWIRAILTSQDDPLQVLLPDPSAFLKGHLDEYLDEYVWLARAYQRLSHFKASTAVLNAVLTIDPDHGYALRSLATTLRRAGNTAEALPIYERALNLSPEKASVRYNYACVLHDLGYTEQARVQWQQVIEEDTDMADKARAALRIVGDLPDAEEKQA